jgi:hypothetical protein
MGIMKLSDGRGGTWKRQVRRFAARRISDDAGQPYELGCFEHDRTPDLAGPETALAREELDSVLRRYRLGWTSFLLLMGGMCVVTLGGQLIGMAVATAFGGIDRSVQPHVLAWWSYLVMFAPAFGALIAWAFFIDRTLESRRVRRAAAMVKCLLRVRCCPVCGRSLDVGSAGVEQVTCTCGARWNSDRVGKAAVARGRAYRYPMAVLLQQVYVGGWGHRMTDHRGVRRTRVSITRSTPPLRAAERIRVRFPPLAGALLVSPILIPFISVFHSPMIGQRLNAGSEVLPYAIPLLAAALGAAMWLSRHGRWRSIRLRNCPTCHDRLKKSKRGAASDEFTCTACGSVWDARRRHPLPPQKVMPLAC